MSKSLRAHLLKNFAHNLRYDGRTLLDFRPITIEKGIIRSAEGSARVMIGKTHVIAGVKLGLETPYPDTPDEGNLMVNVELLPLSSPLFESGPPSDQAVEIARVVDRCIREAHAIDTKKLCIKVGEKAWSVMVDICTINDDGNILDAAALAALAALQDAKFPKIVDGKVDYLTKTTTSVPLTKDPISITVYKLVDKYFVDPLPEEEKMADVRLTCAVTKENTICSMQKGGATPLTVKDIDHMIGIAIQHAPNLRQVINSAKVVKI